MGVGPVQVFCRAWCIRERSMVVFPEPRGPSRRVLSPRLNAILISVSTCRLGVYNAMSARLSSSGRPVSCPVPGTRLSTLCLTLLTKL